MSHGHPGTRFMKRPSVTSECMITLLPTSTGPRVSGVGRRGGDRTVLTRWYTDTRGPPRQRRSPGSGVTCEGGVMVLAGVSVGLLRPPELGGPKGKQFIPGQEREGRKGLIIMDTSLLGIHPLSRPNYLLCLSVSLKCERRRTTFMEVHFFVGKKHKLVINKKTSINIVHSTVTIYNLYPLHCTYLLTYYLFTYLDTYYLTNYLSVFRKRTRFFRQGCSSPVVSVRRGFSVDLGTSPFERRRTGEWATGILTGDLNFRKFPTLGLKPFERIKKRKASI